MKQIYGLAAVGLLMISVLLLSGCGEPVAAAPGVEDPPARIEHLEGMNPTRETLTAEAAERLGIETASVTATMDGGVQRRAVPYAAVIYDTQGKTWVYTSTSPLVFERTAVAVDDISGEQAFISDGPAAGALVVTTGAEELYGAEFEFQEE